MTTSRSTTRPRAVLRGLVLAVLGGLLLAACAGGEQGDDVAAELDAAVEDADVSAPVEDADDPAADDEDADGDLTEDGDAAAGGGAAGSCLAGDEDCTDESYDGQDVARILPLDDAPLTGEPATVGSTSGATAAMIQGVRTVDDTILELQFGGSPCTLVEDVLVDESDTEVRIMVLAGQDASVDACIEMLVLYTITVTLDAPLGDRAVVDLAG